MNIRGTATARAFPATTRLERADKSCCRAIQSCRHSFEKLTVNGENECNVCRKCENKAAKRVLVPTGFISQAGAGGCGNGLSRGFS